jgi:glycosyltransferase involved in cell wall biosynthesis
MRVVQVNYAFDAGLASSADLLHAYATLTGWAEALARAGAEVLTVQQFRTSSNVTRDGLPYTFGTFNEIAEATLRFRPDVVHVNGLDAPLRTWILRRWLPLTPIVVQDHASRLSPDRSAEASRSVRDGARGFSRALRRPIRRHLMSAVDAFLFSTLAQATPWRDAGLIAARQGVYEVLEASTGLRALDGDEARSASGVTGDPAVVWIGRLNANKDPLTVLDAFDRFASTYEGATLTMIFHEHDLLDGVRGRVAVSARLRERVRLAGEVPHDRIAAFLSAADLFVVGSHHEGSGYALLEAMACGATPVVTDIPSFRAIVGASQVPGTCPAPGWHLWPPGDADACARALASASQSRDRQRVIDHFERNLTWEAVGRKALTIYSEVIRGKGLGIRNPRSNP